MLPELFVLVVTIIAPITGSTNFSTTTIEMSSLSFEECKTRRHEMYNEALKNKFGVVAKCVRQQ